MSMTQFFRTLGISRNAPSVAVVQEPGQRSPFSLIPGLEDAGKRAKVKPGGD